MQSDLKTESPAPRRPVFLYCAFGLIGIWLLASLVFSLVLAQGPANEGWQWIFFLGVAMLSAAAVFALCGIFAGISLARREGRQKTAWSLIVVSCTVVWLLKGIVFRVFERLLGQ